jgi:hypothetical protein
VTRRLLALAAAVALLAACDPDHRPANDPAPDCVSAYERGCEP